MQTSFLSNTQTENTLPDYDVNDLKSGYLSETERGPERFAESTNKGVNEHSKYVIQQQRPEWPTVIVTWHACISSGGGYVPCTYTHAR